MQELPIIEDCLYKFERCGQCILQIRGFHIGEVGVTNLLGVLVSWTGVLIYECQGLYTVLIRRLILSFS